MEIHLNNFAFLLGVFLHVLAFCRNEWDRRSPWILLFFCMLSAGRFIGLVVACRYPYIKALLETNVLGVFFLGGLFSSMMAYRLLFHPLKSFPGPVAARISALWLTKESIPDMTFYRQLRGLHDQYGDFVRIRKGTSFSIWSHYLHPDKDLENSRYDIQMLLQASMDQEIGFRKANSTSRTILCRISS